MELGRDDSQHDPLVERLDALAQFRTHTPFSQLFDRLIVAWSGEAGREAGELREACLRYLDAELWYHQTLANLSARDDVSYEDLRSVADKRRIALTALAERLDATRTDTPRANVVKHLMLAEVHYHLRETPTTVAELEAAIAAGGGHPLVHFALGYNRFDQARELFVMTQTASPKDTEKLEREFRDACLSAAEAFRGGLTGQLFDAQLHLWIGRSLAAAGMSEEAEAALKTAAHIDPSIFSQPPMLDEPEGDAEGATDDEESGPESLPDITEEEIALADELLKRRWRVEEVLG
jgi:tetratricopeptide (TPR) repeat protein